MAQGALRHRQPRVLAKPFGVRMLASAFGPDKGRAAELGTQHVPVEQLLRESDIVSMQLKLSADMEGYLGRFAWGPITNATQWGVRSGR
jgi:phosphoglycerate dehydrogenase-like enzyme